MIQYLVIDNKKQTCLTTSRERERERASEVALSLTEEERLWREYLGSEGQEKQEGWSGKSERGRRNSSWEGEEAWRQWERVKEVETEWGGLLKTTVWLIPARHHHWTSTRPIIVFIWLTVKSQSVTSSPYGRGWPEFRTLIKSLISSKNICLIRKASIIPPANR